MSQSHLTRRRFLQASVLGGAAAVGAGGLGKLVRAMG
jgi:hypothetical protein